MIRRKKADRGHPGKPLFKITTYEALVGNLQGVYSRRINIQHRLVYQVYSEPVEWNGMRYDGTVKIIRMWTHYDGSLLIFLRQQEGRKLPGCIAVLLFYGRVE